MNDPKVFKLGIGKELAVRYTRSDLGFGVSGSQVRVRSREGQGWVMVQQYGVGLNSMSAFQLRAQIFGGHCVFQLFLAKLRTLITVGRDIQQ